jgi:hypothetical protein
MNDPDKITDDFRTRPARMAIISKLSKNQKSHFLVAPQSDAAEPFGL